MAPEEAPEAWTLECRPTGVAWRDAAEAVLAEAARRSARAKPAVGLQESESFPDSAPARAVLMMA